MSNAMSPWSVAAHFICHGLLTKEPRTIYAFAPAD